MRKEGEPDAGNLHVRFDGREVETENGRKGGMVTAQRPAMLYFPKNDSTAPPLDPTMNASDYRPLGCPAPELESISSIGLLSPNRFC